MPVEETFPYGRTAGAERFTKTRGEHTSSRVREEGDRSLVDTRKYRTPFQINLDRNVSHQSCERRPDNCEYPPIKCWKNIVVFLAYAYAFSLCMPLVHVLFSSQRSHKVTRALRWCSPGHRALSLDHNSVMNICVFSRDVRADDLTVVPLLADEQGSTTSQ